MEKLIHMFLFFICTGTTQTSVPPLISEPDDLFGGSTLTSTNPPWDFVDHSISPSSLFGNTGRPFPTNVWWQNMVLNNGDLISVVDPYIVKTLSDGLHLSLPVFYGSETLYAMTFHDELTMSSLEELGDHTVSSYDELSVTVSWDGGITAPIVRGMPYATVIYDNKTPVLKFGGAILSPSGQISGSRFVITLNNNHKWILYTSSSITFDVIGQSLTCNSVYSGYVRAAGIVEGSDNAVEVQDSVDILDNHSDKVPLGGTVSAKVTDDTALMKFTWETTGTGDLLMMALPHQLKTITNPRTSHTSNVLKGKMVAVTGDVWTFYEPLTTISWGAPRSFPSQLIDDLKNSLSRDITNTACCGDDPYFGGKQMAVFARLALLADEIGESALANQAREKVLPLIEGWLAGTNSNKLLYDQTWGGVVSKNGMEDQAADFGNGMYNDHHFHYGYHIYTAAVLAKADPAWGDIWNDKVLHMISDLADPSRSSQWYPFARTKDLFDGHAWASGIFEFADGKNQESTSESVNGWYAIYLYGLATNNNRLKDLGRLFTALEIRSARHYWQMTSEESVYPELFSKNKAVGILWSSKVDYATWFGANVEFIHCIQMLPFTPISEELLRKSWISEEYDVLREAYSRNSPPLSEGWKGYVIMAHAVIDPNTAYREALQLNSFDDGNTESNTLYWIATRPGFNVSGPTFTPTPSTEPTSSPMPAPSPLPSPSPAPTPSPTPGGCNCNNPTKIDQRCLNPPTDPWGGLGCKACGVQNCRFCGFGSFPSCN